MFTFPNYPIDTVMHGVSVASNLPIATLNYSFT